MIKFQIQRFAGYETGHISGQKLEELDNGIAEAQQQAEEAKETIKTTKTELQDLINSSIQNVMTDQISNLLNSISDIQKQLNELIYDETVAQELENFHSELDLLNSKLEEVNVKVGQALGAVEHGDSGTYFTTIDGDIAGYIPVVG